MKRRLRLAIVGSVAAALLLAGVGTLGLVRIGAAERTETDLRAQAQATAQLIASATSGFARLGDAETRALVAQICDAALPEDGVARATSERIRAAVCDGGLDSVPTAAARICSATWDGLDRVFEPSVEAARTTFCAGPDAEQLERFRRVLCDAEVVNTNAAVRRQMLNAREALCRSIVRRDLQRVALQETLVDEAIGLVVLDGDGRLTSGQLPSGVAAADLDLAALADGTTVSGLADGAAWAVAPISTDGEISAVVLEREVTAVGQALPFFLLAAGVTLLLGAVVADRVSARLTAPLHDAIAAAERVAEGDLAVRLPEHQDRAAPDELDELGRAINTMTAALDRAQGLEQQFLLSISHDLRTPLTSIQGYAEAIADGAVDDPAVAAGVIQAEGRRLERLVGDLLLLATLDARSFGFTIGPVDLRAVVQDAAEGCAPSCDAAGLHLEVHVPPEPVWVAADADRLRQVLANLVENAAKFAAGTIAMVVDPAVPAVVVDDDGPGIAPADLPHVFERLYVSAHEPVRAETGSGLGLAIVRELVEGMGGTVTATAAPGGGSRMVVSLAAGPPPPTATP